MRCLLDALFKISCNLASHRILVLNVATVDVPGCDIKPVERPYNYELHPFLGGVIYQFY